MNGQEQAILEILLSNENYVSYEMLAEKLNVSVRTIMRLIKNMDRFLAGFFISIEVKRRSGIRLLGTEEHLEALRTALNLENTGTYTGNDRLAVILMELFETEDFVKAYYLAYLLNVSAGTVNRDMETVKKFLEQNGLGLISQRGAGWKVTGDKHTVRQALVRVFKRYVDMSNWFGNEQEVVFRIPLSAGVRRRMNDFLNFPGLYRTYLLLQTFDYTVEENSVQEDYQKYVIYTHIVLHFPHISQYFSGTEKETVLREHVLYPRMNEFAKKIRKEEGTVLSEEERCALLAVYLSIRRNESLFTVYKYDEEVHQMTLELLEDVETELQRKLTDDALLVERLSAHLNLMFDRLHLGTMADSADLEQLKEEYPHIFEIVQKKVAVFAKRNQIDISEDETGYIIIHILASIVEKESEKQIIRTVVLCMSGIGTSQMLAQRLRNHFPRMEIAAVCSLADFKEEEFAGEKIDLIVSTVKTETLTVPAIQIKPVPGEEDFKRLREICEEITDTKLRASFARAYKPVPEEMDYQMEKALRKLSFMEQILESFSFDRIWADTLEELYERVASQMFSESLSQTEFAELLKARGKQGSIIFHDSGMILLHGRTGRQGCLKIFSVQGEPDYIVDGKWVQVRRAVVMTAPKDAKGELLELLSCISAALVQEEQLVKAIECEKEEQIFRLLGRLMSEDVFE